PPPPPMFAPPPDPPPAPPFVSQSPATQLSPFLQSVAAVHAVLPAPELHALKMTSAAQTGSAFRSNFNITPACTGAREQSQCFSWSGDARTGGRANALDQRECAHGERWRPRGGPTATSCAFRSETAPG